MAPSPAERTVDAEFLVEFIFEINSKFQSTTSFHKAFKDLQVTAKKSPCCNADWGWTVNKSQLSTQTQNNNRWRNPREYFQSLFCIQEKSLHFSNYTKEFHGNFQFICVIKEREFYSIVQQRNSRQIAGQN